MRSLLLLATEVDLPEFVEVSPIRCLGHSAHFTSGSRQAADPTRVEYAVRVSRSNHELQRAKEDADDRPHHDDGIPLPEQAEHGFEIVQQSIVPSIKEQPGYKGILFLRDPQTGAATAVTLWESEADATAAATGNYPAQLAKVQGLLAGPPTRHLYEVTEVSL
jgi:heme-degrading monooxygenase HmoA